MATRRDLRPELAESLAVCLITAAEVNEPPADLSVLARPSGMWHHQLRTSTGTTHFARSTQHGFRGPELQVELCTASAIPSKLDDAIAWIDEQVPDDDVVVRLLVIPAYFVHALLVIRGKKFSAVLVDQPATFQRLQYRKLYTLRDFLKRLSKETSSGSLA
jgi:hypothetical protein